MSPRLSSAFSAAGAGMAERLRAGDEIRPEDFTRRLAEAVNYSLRARGLRIRALETSHGAIRTIVVEEMTS